MDADRSLWFGLRREGEGELGRTQNVQMTPRGHEDTAGPIVLIYMFDLAGCRVFLAEEGEEEGVC